VDWEDLRHFLAVAHAGSVTGAAKVMRMSPSTLIRRVREFERTLGAPLFNRSRDGYALTPFGMAIYERARNIEAEALAISRLAGGHPDAHGAVVRVAATDSIGARWFAPLVPELRARLPGTTIELVTSTRNVDLARREADLSIRLARPTQNGLLIRKVGEIAYAPYVQRGAAADAGWIGWDPSLQELPIARAVETRRGEESVVLRTVTVEAQLQAALAGVGIALLPCFVADDEPSLVRRRDGQPDFFVDMWTVVHPDLRHNRAVRTTVDFIALAAGRDRQRLAGGLAEAA
jgi:DNA-binding transcriptional LysR family regulator